MFKYRLAETTWLNGSSNGIPRTAVLNGITWIDRDLEDILNGHSPAHQAT